MNDFSSYQRKVIKRYYDNRDQIDETRLSEIVTSLYLATTDKQRTKLWTTAREMMERLEVPKSRVEHVCETQNAAVLAEVVKDITSGVIKRTKTPKPAPPEE